MIVNDHILVKNVSDLAEYLNNKIPLSWHRKFFVDDENNLINGDVDLVFFELEFVYGKRLMLSIKDENEEVTSTLFRLLSAVMWNVDESIKDNVICAPILKYDDNQRNAKRFEWEYENPLERLKKFAIEYYRFGMDVDNVEITYKNMDLNSLKEQIKYGAYKGYFTSDELKEIDKLSEIELFVSVKHLEKRIGELYYAAEYRNSHSGLYEKSVEYSYKLHYLEQQAKKFGVSVNEPTFEQTSQSEEYIAWFKWWNNSIKKILKANPEIKRNLFHGDHNFNIKPEGSFNDFLEKPRD